ncbi:MAG: hypothetical protein SPG03_01310 [Veillonella caviae]|nr:hypothetical protein [Veillonella caviae]
MKTIIGATSIVFFTKEEYNLSNQITFCNTFIVGEEIHHVTQTITSRSYRYCI